MTEPSGLRRVLVLSVAVSAAVVFGGAGATHADGGLAVTQVSGVQTSATADGTYANGWKWLFSVTVPAGQTSLQMKFADWTAGGATIPAAGNMQFYSAQAATAKDEAHAVPITAAGTGTSIALDPAADLDSYAAGKQIQVTVEMRIPAGSAAGAYATTYGVNASGEAEESSGASAITISADPNQPAARLVAMGAVGSPLAAFRLTEMDNIESVKVTDLVITDMPTPADGNLGFVSLSLVNGSATFGTSAAAVNVNGVFTYAFHLSSPIVVPRGGSLPVTLTGNAVAFSASVTDNSRHVFSIASSGAVTALGAVSAKTTAVLVTNATGNPQTLVRNAAPVAGTTAVQNGKQPLSEIGTFSLRASGTGAIQPAKLTVTFSGNGYIQGSSTFLSTVVLRDPSGNDVTSYASGAAVKVVTPSASDGTVTWTFPVSSPLAVSPGTQALLHLWAETDVIPAVPQTAESLSATIQNAGDFQYYDGTDAAAFATGPIGLPATTVPVTLSSLSWGVGQ